MSELSIVRVVRPYATEAEWLREEGWTIARKSVYLIDIPTQPEGTLVRCELSLASGSQLLVAEGVVVKYVADHGDRPPGLVVRYRRLSTASSQFISRVLGTRDQSETSSPSVTDNALPPPSETSNPLSVSASQRMADSSVTASLERLRGRPTDATVPRERDDVLARLRHRLASRAAR